jgi:hypothetical protein
LKICTHYGVVAKYPSETVIDELITKTALERAQTILAFCQAKVPVAGGAEETESEKR